MSHLAKKTEKIASALYLVTGFFADQEPMKWKLRNLVTDLVNRSTKLKDTFSSNRNEMQSELKNIIDEISSLLSIGKTSGLVSEPNHEILKTELNKFNNEIENPLGAVEQNGANSFANYFLEEPGTAPSSLPRIEPKKTEEVKKDKISETLTPEPDEEVPIASTLKPLKQFGAVSVKKNSRQSVIINLLKRKKEIMIKDVSPLISGCSEKTIQRELLSMVEAGLLKKMGEKRWSRYTLA